MTIGGTEVQAPRFDWIFNFGHVLTSITVMLAMGGAVFAVGQKLESFEHRITTAERAVLQQAPKIETADKANERQDERLRAQGEAISGIRADIAEGSRKMNSLAEGVAGINAKLDTLLRKN